MERCDRRLEPPSRYLKTASGTMAPSVRLRVRPAGAAFAAEHGFQVDTGADVALALADPLRNFLRSAGARPGRDAVRWGPSVRCEVYEVAVQVGTRWLPFEAYYPLGPKLDENLVGLPLLQFMPLCLRPEDEVLHLSRGA